jgi:hypothetical protein
MDKVGYARSASRSSFRLKALLHHARAAHVVELTAVRLLSRASFCVRLWCTEQKLALDVLGVKGAGRWRNWGVRAGNPRDRMAGARCRERVREPNTQAVVGMNLTPENDRFQGGALAPDESRFEKPEIGDFRETALCAHFGWKLQKIFPVQSGGFEPEIVRILLRKIQAKLDKPPVPGDG